MRSAKAWENGCDLRQDALQSLPSQPGANRGPPRMLEGQGRGVVALGASRLHLLQFGYYSPVLGLGDFS